MINIFHFCILFGAAKFNPISNGLCAQDEMQCNALALEVKVCTAAICIDCPRHPIRVTRDDDHTLDNHRFNAIHIRARIQMKNKKCKSEKKIIRALEIKTRKTIYTQHLYIFNVNCNFFERKKNDDD